MNFAVGRKLALISAIVSLCAVNSVSAAGNNLETITATATHAQRSISDAAGTASVKGCYTSEDTSYVTPATFAGENGLVQGVILATYREGDQTETFFDGDSNDKGIAREGADSFNFGSMNLPAKIVFTPNENHRFRLIAEPFESESASIALFASNTSARDVVMAVSLGDDMRDRTRFSLSYELDSSNSLFDRSFAQIYRQESEADQCTRQEQISRGSPRNRNRDSAFNQTVTGLELQFDKSFAFDGTEHYGVFCFDYEL